MYVLCLLAPEKAREEFWLSGESAHIIFGSSSSGTAPSQWLLPDQNSSPSFQSQGAPTECSMAAAYTLNAGNLLLLVACHFVFPMAAMLEMQNVMDYSVQKLNTKK